MTAIGLAENNILRVKKEVFQQSCIEGYFKPRAISLGLKVIEAVPLKEGYRIRGGRNKKSPLRRIYCE